MVYEAIYTKTTSRKHLNHHRFCRYPSFLCTNFNTVKVEKQYQGLDLNDIGLQTAIKACIDIALYKRNVYFNVYHHGAASKILCIN